MIRYNNYHKHSHRSNIFTPDTHVKNVDYAKRAVELGHTTIFSTEHGYGGDIFEIVNIANEYNLTPIFAVEGYIVSNPLEKDNSNYHIVIVPKNNEARLKLNKITSHANTEGYYYKPRIFLDDLLNCDKDSFYITTACCGGILKTKDSFENIFMKLYEHYKDNIFLETQPHLSDSQIQINKKAIILADKLKLKLIHANDSHYIYPSDSKDRLEFLKGKGINYGEEDAYILDYPSYDEIVNRYKEQGVLNEEQIKEALDSTLIFDNINNIEINKNIKMPNIYSDLTIDERMNKLKEIISVNFSRIIKEDNITDEELPKYIKSIKEEMQVIEETKQIHTMDYFLLNEKLVKLATEKYNGVLTTTSRGSAGAYYLNRLLGITQLDRNRAKIPLYYQRFMSSARLLGDNPPYTSSLPDCDFNVSDPEPFIKASKELLGENGCKWMLAYGTMKEGEAFRNTCRSKGMNFDEFNEVAKNIDDYREDEKWKPIIDEANKFVDVIVSASAHPCSNILFDGDLEEELGVLKIGDFICCPITSGEADEWKYLKNDYLTVSTVTLTKRVFDMIGIPRMTLVELENALDEKVWDIYKYGLTCTINQIDSKSATEMMKRYKAHTVSEVAIFTGVIRPNFNDYRENFIQRIPYTNGNEEMDKMFEATQGYIVFQENLMSFFEWLSIPPNVSISLIKKISKKKIKQKDFDDLVETIKKVWIDKGYNGDDFDSIWETILTMMSYGYNSPHALAMAYDSLYGAYLKSHYPLEYYSVALDMYAGDEERTTRMTKELEYFNINILPPKFKYSKGNYFIDKESNSIYKGVGSIKFLNPQIGDDLYNLSKDKTYNSFLELLIDLENVSINSKQLDILIKLGYFSEFGGSQKLLRITHLYNTIYTKKQFKKNTMDKSTQELFRKYAAKETEKMFKDVKIDELLNEVIPKIPNEDIPIKVFLETQKEYLGYIDYKNPNYQKGVAIVTDIKVTSYGTVFVTLSQVCDGKNRTLKVDKRYFGNKPLEKYQMIKINNIKQRYKKTKIDGRWVDSNVTEYILDNYSLIIE